MTDASPMRDVRPVRSTWVWAGALLIVSVLPLLTAQTVGLPGLVWIGRSASAAALVLFAVGKNSVVALRWLGVAALVVLAVWPTIAELVGALLPSGPHEAFATLDDTTLALNMSVSALFDVVGIAAALIAVVQVWRAGVVPPILRWVPTASLVLCVAPVLVLTLVSIEARGALDPTGLQAASGVASLLGVVGWLGLGVAAIVAGILPRPGAPRGELPSIRVYPPPQ